MQILIDDTLLRPFAKKYKEIEALMSYRGGDKIRIDLTKMTDKVVDELREALEKVGGKGRGHALSSIRLYQETIKNPNNAKVKNLQHLVAALKAYIGQSKHLYLFKQNTYDDQWMPYVVTKIHYYPYDQRNEIPAHVDMQMAYYEGGEIHTSRETFYSSDCNGTVAEILRAETLCLENEVIMLEYEDGVLNYKLLYSQTGLQVVGTNYAKESSKYGRSRVALEVDGIASRLVIDDEPEDDEGNTRKNVAKIPMVSASFWGRPNYEGDVAEIPYPKGTKSLDEDADEEPDEEPDEENLDEEAEKEADENQAAREAMLKVPLHPYINTFDLRRHTFVAVHASNVVPYKYDKKVSDKLILPEEAKELISILIENAHGNFEDIIKGKSGGSIILCAGTPGTGKTLTAEVYSEIMERPLYTVQCSQLGLDINELEKELKHVLTRAMRWRAILLLDEADVYIHARGADIEQNAIVGIFLRVLEYYNGVLFMTTNRAEDIDDAIESRATAKLVYTKPTPEQQELLWKVLSPGAGLVLKPALIKTIVKAHNDLNGRDIKNLSKLASLIAKKRGVEVSAELIGYVRKFKQA